GEYGLQCEHCSKMYRNRSDLKYHLRTQHNSTFQYNCVRCGIGLSTRLDVERHQSDAAAKHQNSCEFCGKTFVTASGRHKHLKLMHGYKRFECDVCHKRYRTLKDRNYHKKTVHQGIYRYYCAKCGRGLHSLARLNRH
ncbi:hypothetical protein CAPTEDRAFT_86147, partial [Capitella teleta]